MAMRLIGRSRVRRFVTIGRRPMSARTDNDEISCQGACPSSAWLFHGALAALGRPDPLGDRDVNLPFFKDQGIGFSATAGALACLTPTCMTVMSLPILCMGRTCFYGDGAYRRKAPQERLNAQAPKAKDFTNKRAYRNATHDRCRQRNESPQVRRSCQGRAFLPLP